MTITFFLIIVWIAANVTMLTAILLDGYYNPTRDYIIAKNSRIAFAYGLALIGLFIPVCFVIESIDTIKKHRGYLK